MDNSGKLKVAILGSGNIGTDLLLKALRSEKLETTLFIGRHFDSKGMLIAKKLGINTSDQGISSIIDMPECCNLVFDATSAVDHVRHAAILKDLGKIAIDLTPSRVGAMVVPAVGLHYCENNRNVNMISCGGQASIPIAYLIGKTHHKVHYVEVVSSIASKSAGPATRINMDEYIETTEAAIRLYSGAVSSKVILILNPAEPPVNMQTTISAKVDEPNIEGLQIAMNEMMDRIQAYVPGYEVIVPPVYESNRIVVMVRVVGLGDYLPSYAGNLDIINCAAIAIAEGYSDLYCNRLIVRDI
jgi:acetaldehyde dehydrogenase